MRSLSPAAQQAFFDAGLAACGLGQDPRRRRRTWTVRPGFGEQTRPGTPVSGTGPGGTPRGGAGSGNTGGGSGPGGPFVPANAGGFVPGAANPFAPGGGGGGYPFSPFTPGGGINTQTPGSGIIPGDGGGDPNPGDGQQSAGNEVFGQGPPGFDILPRLEMPPITGDGMSVNDAGSPSGSSTYTFSPGPGGGGGGGKVGGVAGLGASNSIADTLLHAALSGIVAAAAVAATPAIVKAARRALGVLAFAVVCSLTAAPANAQLWISASRGSDANPGTETQPIQTWREAEKRTRNKPQPIRLFEAEAYPPIIGEYGPWTSAGVRIEAWPLDGTRRPLIVSNGPTAPAGILVQGDMSAPIDIIGLEFIGTGPGGIIQRGKGAGIRLADVIVRGFANSLIIEGLDRDRPGDKLGRITNAEAIRCGFYDATSATSHAQGIYASNVDGLYVAQSVIDNAGRNAAGHGTIFNHAAYIQPQNTGVAFENNIITNSSATGLQLRGGNARAVNNFLARNAIAIGAGHAQSGETTFTGLILANIIIEPVDISPTLPRGWAMTTHKLAGATIAGNLAFGGTPTSRRGLYREPGTWSRQAWIEENWFVGFAAPLAFETPAAPDENFAANRFASSLPVVSPRVDVAALLTYHRSRPRNTWEDAFSAEQINNAIRRLNIRNPDGTAHVPTQDITQP
jgi:hypothetical protein